MCPLKSSKNLLPRSRLVRDRFQLRLPHRPASNSNMMNLCTTFFRNLITMNHQTKTLRYGLTVLLIVAGFAFSGALLSANAQNKTEARAAKSRSNQGGRDPFRKYEPPRVVAKSSGQI